MTTPLHILLFSVLALSLPSTLLGALTFNLEIPGNTYTDPTCNADATVPPKYCNDTYCGCLLGEPDRRGCLAKFDYSYLAEGSAGSTPYYIQLMATSDCYTWYLAGETLPVTAAGANTISQDYCFGESFPGQRYCVAVCVREGAGNEYLPGYRYPYIYCRHSYQICFNTNGQAGTLHPSLTLDPLLPYGCPIPLQQDLPGGAASTLDSFLFPLYPY